MQRSIAWTPKPAKNTGTTKSAIKFAARRPSVEDHCFLAGCDGKLHVIDLANGEETGAIEIEAPTGSTPAAVGELIYFGTEGATFFCIDWKAAERSMALARQSSPATDSQ